MDRHEAATIADHLRLDEVEAALRGEAFLTQPQREAIYVLVNHARGKGSGN